MSTNTKSDGQITQQSNLRRAADFIADEIKSASVVSTSLPSSWSSATFPTTATLYLEIPVPIEAFSGTTLTVKNHGLIKGNAVRFSGTDLPAGMTSDVTYYVKTPTLTTSNVNELKNEFTVVNSLGTDISFSNPRQFQVRRLVAYYTAAANLTTDKGIKALYRRTGSCNPSSNTSEPTNCLTMIDSLAETSPFTVQPTTVSTPNQFTLTFNGQLCTPPTMANNDCTSPATTNVSMIAISRAILK